jgi:hypothetical protein
MGITLSPQEYATAFRVLAATARHPENIGQAVEKRILPGLPKQPALLDVGAGSGKVAERLAPYFGSLTLLEPNRDQIAGFKHEKAKIHLESLESYHSPEKYELGKIDERIRMHAERCRGADGVYRLEQDEDLIIIPKP